VRTLQATGSRSAAQMPNFTAHSNADVKHSDMFIDVLEKYVAAGREQDVLTTAADFYGHSPGLFRRHSASDGEKRPDPGGRWKGRER
jgi:hypothetical protein